MVRLPMEEIAISKFKATCLAVLERVRTSGEPVRVTRFGHPVAEIVPPRVAAPRRDWMGANAGSVRFIGDLVSPVMDEQDIEALGP